MTVVLEATMVTVFLVGIAVGVALPIALFRELWR
jgi:hypothetical protein